MSEASIKDSLNGALTAEHRRLDQLWDETQEALANDSSPKLLARLEAFEQTLRQHIADEEEVLFPCFEERTGMRPGGPTVVMRMEHRQMEALLRELMLTISEGSDSFHVFERVNAFSALMDGHDKKEEGVLYPMMERAFGGAERRALLAKTSLGRRNR
jgi:hemerythrin-like domain-containing protein